MYEGGQQHQHRTESDSTYHDEPALFSHRRVLSVFVVDAINYAN
jgi:hypothetical protein